MKNFLKDRSGSVTMTFTLTFMALLLGMGIAIDLGRSYSGRIKLQAAVDAAVIAGAGAPLAQQSEVALNTLMDNLKQTQVVPSKIDWTRNADNSFSGKVTANFPIAFMQIAWQNGLEITATATAIKSSVPSEAVFHLDYVKGWYWKQITLWTHTPGDADDKLVATFTYQPNNLFTATGTTTGPFGQPITLGTTYDRAYLRMDVSSDGCAPGYVPKYPDAMNGDTRYWSPYKCVPVGGGKVKTSTIQTYRTDEPATAYRLAVDGKQLANATEIPNIIVCGKSTETAWEDGDNPDPTSPQWSSPDVFFTVDASSCGPNNNLFSPVRLMH